MNVARSVSAEHRLPFALGPAGQADFGTFRHHGDQGRVRIRGDPATNAFTIGVENPGEPDNFSGRPLDDFFSRSRLARIECQEIGDHVTGEVAPLELIPVRAIFDLHRSVENG